MHIYAKVLTGSLALLSAAAGSGQAQEIGVKFVGNGSPLLSTDSAGLIPQTNFNNETGSSGTASALLDSTGAATGIGLTYTSSGTFSAKAEDNTDQFTGTNGVFMDGYLDNYGGTTGTVKLTGFTPGSSHDVIVYSLESTVGRGGPITVNGAVLTETAATSTSYVAGVNYLDFANTIADNTGAITITTDTNTFREAIQGLQVGISAVPEPVSLGAVAGIAALGVTLRRRRA